MLLFFGLGFGLWFVYRNNLSKILVCGADDTFFYFRFMFMSICFVIFIFYFLRGVRFCFFFLDFVFCYERLSLFHWLEHCYIEW
jgi:hypothetical protein